jgi:large subunit ribosomal protein L25
MADSAKLEVQKRTVTGKAVKQLRREGLIPGNVSNHNGQPIPVQLQAHELQRFMKEHPRTTLIKLAIPGMREQTALLGHVQREPVSGKIQHVDFLQVDVRTKVRARIPIQVMGESTAVKNGEGIVLQLVNDLEVEALPGDLPSVIVVDVTGLPDVGNTMHVGDLFLPNGVNFVHAAPEEPVVKIGHTKHAEAEAAAEVPGPEASEAAEESGREHEMMAAE